MQEIDYAILDDEYIYEGATLFLSKNNKPITVTRILKNDNGDVYLKHQAGIVALKNVCWNNDVDDL